MLFNFSVVFSVANVDYSKTDSFELLFKTITCNKFLQIKKCVRFHICRDFITVTSNSPGKVHVLATRKYRTSESSDPPKVAIGKGC